jgi:hypothetical protein
MSNSEGEYKIPNPKKNVMMTEAFVKRKKKGRARAKIQKQSRRKNR